MEEELYQELEKYLIELSDDEYPYGMYFNWGDSTPHTFTNINDIL
jgi:hypothetical protein